jgi:O-antigen/teichoic acid export membrane protein
MKGMSRVIFRNSVFGLAAQLLVKLLSFAFSVLVVRHLGAESYGQYAAILAFGALFVFLADLGLSPFLVREIAFTHERPNGRAEAEALYGDALALRMVLSVLTALVVIGAGWLTNRPLPMLAGIALGTLGLLMYGGQGTADAMLAGHERLDLSATTRVANQLMFVVVGSLALSLGMGYFGLIGANLAGVALMTWGCFKAVRSLGVQPRRPHLERWPVLVRKALPFGAIAFTLGLSYKFDSVLLNLFRGDSETGYYAAAYSLVFSAVMLSNVLNTALYPSLSRAAVAAAAILPSIYDRALCYLTVIALPVSVGMWLLAAPVVQLLFGPGYAATAPALQIVIWTVPLMFASEFLGYIVVIQGRERRVAQALLVSTTFNVALNLILIPRFGLIGAAVMTVLTEAVLVSQYVWSLRCILRKMQWGRILLRPIIAACAMGCTIHVARDLPLVVSIGAGGAAYLIMLLALGVIGVDEVRFLRALTGPGPLGRSERTYASG